MNEEKGYISINADNILPIIKKWLYSERDIFLRELIANATDAIHKVEKLSLLGEVKTNVLEPKITIEVDKKAKTITVEDTGIGMTAEEIKRYINQVAFSGLTDFVEKYKGKADEEQIIGHFGLGFYSSFMVSDKVEIDTLSFKEGEQAARWLSSGDTQFEISSSSRTQIGTCITLHISEDSSDLLEVSKIKSLVTKYCAFLKYPIFVQGEQVNDTTPLWTKSPSELKDEDYKNFYFKLFPLSQSEPHFWVHLNVDYPFNLRGVLYFPALLSSYESSLQGEVKLYCNQVYVEDNCKELIPDYLTLLKGVIDCPDLPLNVSRSALQFDHKVQKISQHITKKIADRLTGLYKTERSLYEKYWEDINPFVKFGVMRDRKFFERLKDCIIFKTSSEEFLTLNEYLEKFKDKTDGKIIYASDLSAQSKLISILKEHGVDVVIANTIIDQHFVPFVEMESNRKYSFERIDANISGQLINTTKSTIVDASDNKTASEKIESLFKKYLTHDKVKIRVENLKSEQLPAMLLIDENIRRFREMSFLMTKDKKVAEEIDDSYTLVVNENSPAIRNVLNLSKSFNKDDSIKLIVNQVFDLAYLQQGRLTPETMQIFIDRTSDLLSKIE